MPIYKVDYTIVKFYECECCVEADSKADAELYVEQNYDVYEDAIFENEEIDDVVCYREADDYEIKRYGVCNADEDDTDCDEDDE